MGKQQSHILDCCSAVTLPDVFYNVGTYEEQLQKFMIKYGVIQKVLNKLRTQSIQYKQLVQGYYLNRSQVNKFNQGVYIGKLTNKMPNTITSTTSTSKINYTASSQQLNQRSIFFYQIPVLLNQANQQQVYCQTLPTTTPTLNQLKLLTLANPLQNNTDNPLLNIRSFYYQGSYKNGQRYGYGIMINDEGQYYIGNWMKNLPHGEGLYVVNNQKSMLGYKGNFISGLQHGHGKQTFQDLSCYQGDFLYGQKHGKGKFSYNDQYQTYYVGQFKQNKISGRGLSDSKYHRYQGEWIQGKMHGNGISYWYNRNKQIIGQYIGQYKNGLKHGFGEYRWGKKVYKGNWKQGEMKSQGVLINYQ